MAYQKKLSNSMRCPFEYALQIFGGKWKSRIICLLHNTGALRFHRISAEMDNISDGVLSAALQELQTAGVVSRAVYAEVPPRENKPQTYRREGEKIGRNKPCPCGSGKKYKDCHGRRNVGGVGDDLTVG